MLGRNEVKHFGYLSRMDVLQASILDYRLDKLDEVIKKRRANFRLYKKLLDRSKIFSLMKKSINLILITHS